LNQTLKELKAQVREAAISRKKEVMEKIEEKKLTNKLTYINSDKYITDTIAEQDKAITKKVINALEAINDKKFTYYREFNFNENLNNIIGAVKSVTFQKASGWVALNEAIALDSTLANFVEIVEPVASELIETLGKNTYYDKLNHKVIEGEIGDAEAAAGILTNVARDLGMTDLNAKQINMVNFKRIEEKAQTKAEQAYKDNAIIRDEKVTEDSIFQVA